ncbi:hypothetical protein JL720_6211 [Aureococcus anophagefferens]|nr:hypothetical protein JL720_6211 [Aureococcus anophagefferens]
MASSPGARLLRIWLVRVAASAPQPKGTATWPRGPRVTCAWDAATHALRVSWPQAVGPAPLPLAADLYEINIAASPLATASGVHVTGGLSAELGLDVLLPETTRISEWTTTVDYLLNHNAADAGGLALLVTLGAQVDFYLGELAPIAGFASGSAADATVAVYCVDALPPAAPGADTARGDARFADYASCNTQEDKTAADCEEATPTDRRWGRLPAAPPRRDATASHPAAGACEPGDAPGDAGCAWRHGATARVVRGAQLYQLGLNASGLTCDLGDFLAPDGDTGRLRQVSPDRDPWVADCAPWRPSRVVPEVPDDAEVFEDVLSMRKLMQAMSQAAKRKASHDVRARNRAAREQVRHEEVMRQVQKAFADQDEYVRRAEARQRNAEQRAWRRRQREEQRERQLRARGGSLPDIHAGPAPAPEEAAAPRRRARARGRGGPGDDDDDGDDAFFERATGGAWDERQNRRGSPPRGRGCWRFGASAPSPPPTPPRAETLYDVLGVAPDATDAHLRRRYKALALRHHPDRTETTRETTELMARINGAYETLCDPETRATYDATALATQPLAPR